MHDHNPTTRIFAANAAGGVWWFGDQLLRNGPSWELVPPILLAVASLVGATRNYLDGRLQRRHADEEFRMRIEWAKLKGFPPLGKERSN